MGLSGVAEVLRGTGLLDPPDGVVREIIRRAHLCYLQDNEGDLTLSHHFLHVAIGDTLGVVSSEVGNNPVQAAFLPADAPDTSPRGWPRLHQRLSPSHPHSILGPY